MIKSIQINRTSKKIEKLKAVVTYEDESTHLHGRDKNEATNRYILGRLFIHPVLKKINKIEFKPGINLIFARNGTGKSTILDILSYCLHARQNYSSHITRKSCDDLFEKLANWPILLSDYDNPKSNIPDLLKIEHDGQALHYFDPEHLVGLQHAGREFDFDFDMKVGMKSKVGSSGEQILMRLENFFNNTETEIKYKQTLETCRNSWKGEIKEPVISKLLTPSIDPGQITYILDEPTRSLDSYHEAAFWDLIDKSRDKQIIIVTHSPYALFLKDVNYIELTPGYIEQCKKWFNEKI